MGGCRRGHAKKTEGRRLAAKEAEEDAQRAKLPPVKMKEKFFGREALLRRYRVVFDIECEGRSFLRPHVLVREIANKHALGDASRVVLKRRQTQFGRAREIVVALVYDSAQSCRSIERPHTVKKMAEKMSR